MVQIIRALPAAVLSAHTPSGIIHRPVSAPITNAKTHTFKPIATMLRRSKYWQQITL
jgi:hypothetical protein